jgi:hypothetical protein
VTGSPSPSEDAADARLEALYDHLRATEELPIDPKTNRWLGEAEAVARDAARNDLDSETTRTRVRQVQHLLESADEPAHDGAAAHVEAARELCTAILENR